MNPHLSGNGVLWQNWSPLRTIADDAGGVAFGREHVQGPFSQLPLGVVVVAQTSHSKVNEEVHLLKLQRPGFMYDFV